MIRETFPLLGVIAVLIAVSEMLLYRRLRQRAYPWKEALCSAIVGILSRLTGGLTAPLVFRILSFTETTKVPAISMEHPVHWVVLFFCAEFFYYWFHRSAHCIPLMWASHSVHHSSTRLNFMAAQRLSLFPILGAGWLFLVPLIWMGFPVKAVLLYMAFNLMHQFFLHTELIPRLGPLEWFWNTPSHHRVHHDRSGGRSYRNLGGVVIVFDRLFGTFETETDHPEIDPKGVPTAFNPIRASLDGWRQAYLLAARRPGWVGRLKFLLTPRDPGRRR